MSARAPRRFDDELGWERYCGRCEEWWPEDSEFWVIQHLTNRPTPTTGYMCRACRRESEAIAARQKRALQRALDGAKMGGQLGEGLGFQGSRPRSTALRALE